MRSNCAFVFPGQGSQSSGLLRSLMPYFSETITQTFEEASEVLGYDLWQLVQNGTLEQLNQTIYTQPIVLTASITLWRLWSEQSKITPDFLAGHSLGEYSAYVCSGTLSFATAIQLVSQRASYMQAAVQQGPQGAMAAIVGLSAPLVADLCVTAKPIGHVMSANYNTPTQTVVSGALPAVDYVISLAKQKGAQLARKIPVSIPAHCLLMKPAVKPFQQVLQQVQFLPPTIPIINTLEGQGIIEDPAIIKPSLIKQLYSPVRWSDSVQYLIQQGIEYFIECGPGSVLTKFIKQISPVTRVFSIHRYQEFSHALSTLAKYD